MMSPEAGNLVAIMASVGLIARGLTYLKDGKRALARKDFEKLLSENSA